MRKLLNVLYVTNPEAYLSKEGESITVSINGKEVKRIPSHNLEGIICFGYQGASPKVMAMCTEKGIGLSFVTEYGQFLCRVNGKVNGNVLLRKQQYRISDHRIKSGHMARSFVIGKLLNCRNVLLRFKREHGDLCDEKYIENIASIEEIINQVNKSVDVDIDTIRGLEGIGAKTYFDCFDHFILSNKEDFYFKGRNKRPPLDRMNALLSFIYVLLAHDVTSALETVGLDPQVGFLHRDRPGRNSLALDLMEELRPYLADRLALTLINTNMLTKDDFVEKENKAVLLKPDSTKIVLTQWQKRKKEVITHPFLNEKIEIGLIPYAQALLLARTIRGDMETYPPFITK